MLGFTVVVDAPGSAFHGRRGMVLQQKGTAWDVMIFHHERGVPMWFAAHELKISP